MLIDAHEIWIDPNDIRPIHLKFEHNGQQATIQFSRNEATELANDLLDAVRKSNG